MTPDSVDTALEAVPLADTLDEATLRRVFADAPALLDVPRDVKSLYSARMRTLGGDNRVALLALWAVTLAAGGVFLLLGSMIPGVVLVGVALATAIGVSVWQHSQAGDDFFARYANARGLFHREDGHVAAGVPLFGRGDHRKWPRVLEGTIAGQSTRLAHYTYVEVSTDGDGNRDETSYDFTVLAFSLPPDVAQRFKGVYCSPRKLTFGALQDKLFHDRKVELESAEFHKRYTLRVDDSQDDVALYELFSTTFIHQLATDLEVYWEQCGSDFVAWRDGHETEAADLDRFCLQAWHVMHRYVEEYR